MNNQLNKSNQSRTVLVLIMLLLLGGLNTVLASVLRVYPEWFAWTIYGVMAALIAVALRFQQRLSVPATIGLLTVPFVLAIVGALLG
jgi:uncharacterized membrane protein